jgi:hypothetical protein
MSIYNQSKKVDVDIPLLLAGPILRRVEKSKVCVWIATSKKVQARLRIFRLCGFVHGGQVNSSEIIPPNSVNAIQESQPNLQLVGEGNNSPLQLGDKLFINLIIAKPLHQTHDKEALIEDSRSLGFPTNELLAYDLELISDSETGIRETISLKDLGLLHGENSIIYSRGDDTSPSTEHYDNYENGYNYPALPIFFIANTEDASSLNLLYGSCRKLYGDEDDSLIIGDKLLQDSVYDLEKRPSALYLIGDQIYADDVADPLIAFIKRLSSKLLGWEERIRGFDRKLGELSTAERKDIVSNYAKFSTEVGDNHLLGFGEFAAMYIIAWNQLVWPNKFYQSTTDDPTNSSLSKKYLNEVKKLEQSRKSLVRIRRLLANIPTYMICDDHEITDDWNINKKWSEDVGKSICGKQIISNGLLAFWAFQAWGNDPESYSHDFIQKVQQSLYSNRKSSIALSRISHEPTVESSRLSLNTKKNGIVNLDANEDLDYHFIMSTNWTFVAPTYPLSIFIDCRTQRTFDDEEGPPHLLSDRALDFMKAMVMKAGYSNGDPMILISPTPVFGFELAESVQRFLTSISGSYKWDLETWRANESGFIKFLVYLVNNFNPSYCIFLSGDVHYAFTMRAYFGRNKLTQKINSHFEMNSNKKILSGVPIAQLTSSPFRSNSLTNRNVAILILNLVHKIIVAKKLFKRESFAAKGVNDVQDINYDYFKRLPDIYDVDTKNIPNNDDMNKKQKIYFSKHGNYKSLLGKVRVISFNLIGRHFSTNKNDKKMADSPWSERRLLVKPKAQGNLPVLARNNIGYVHLDLESKFVRHTLYFLDKNGVRNSHSSIQF